MPKRKRNKNNVLRPLTGIIASLAIVAFIVGVINGYVTVPGLDMTTPDTGNTPARTPPASHASPEAGVPETAAQEHTGLALHIINVGDGDCLLLQADGRNMLIDAGHSEDFRLIDAYLKEAGARDFDLALATHPHADHIGAMDMFIKEYKPERVLISPRAHTTKHYENLLDALIETGVKPERPAPGDTYQLGGAAVTVLAPVKEDYGANINDYSVVVRVDYGQTSFLLTGDAEKASEADMLASGAVLGVTVLKLGHHGSKTSTTKEFLEAVSPAVAVASADKDIAVADRLEKRGVPFYSTGEVGGIVITSDGVTVTLTAEGLTDPVMFHHSR